MTSLTTALRVVDSFLLARSLDTFGILLRIFTVGLEKEAAGRAAWVVVAEGSGDEASTLRAIGSADEGAIEAELAGGWQDPEQRACNGPCCLINPAEVTATERKLTEQDDLEITSTFAPIVRAAILNSL